MYDIVVYGHHGFIVKYCVTKEPYIGNDYVSFYKDTGEYVQLVNTTVIVTEFHN